MRVLQFARDSLTSLVSKMGTGRDKSATTYYTVPALTDDQILNAYRGAWLPRKIVDIPAFDSVRAWREWQAKPDQIEGIEAEEKRLNIKGRVLEARIKARLWGGAAIMLGTGDTDLAEKLDVERIGKQGLKYLTVLTRRQLTAGEIDRDPQSEWYGRPKAYTIASSNSAQVSIHPSRLVLFQGNEQPDDDLSTTAFPGWGDSVLIPVMDAIKQADGTAANIAALVFEAKVDVIGVPDLMNRLSDPQFEQQMINRFTLAATGKGIHGMLIKDTNETYEQKAAEFAVLPEILMSFMQLVSGAADIPATRLLGQSPAGMNATGESDLRNYYDRLSALQQLEMEPALRRLDEALIRSALGARDVNIYYLWAPLWGMSEKEKADVFKTKADAARALAGTGTSPALMPIEALSDALVNEFIEDGSLSGLEAAIAEYGKLSEQEEEEADVLAAVMPANNVHQMRRAANDAAPRTLYVRRDVLNGAEIIAWAKGQGFETTLAEDDLHVTIAFSRRPVDWMKVGEAWQSELKVSAGGPRLMERFGEATVLLFKASDLEWRHEAIKDAGATWDHPEYQPHITISYAAGSVDLTKVEPYRGEIVLGPEIFEEVNEDWNKGIKED